MSLTEAIFDVRNGRPTTYEPKSDNEAMQLDYYRACYAIHSGDIEQFETIIRGREWRPPIIQLIFETKRNLYTKRREEFVQSALAIEKALRNQGNMDSPWLNEAVALAATGAEYAEDLERAKALYAETQSVCLSTGDRQKLAEAYSNLGVFAAMEGKLALARHYLALLFRDCYDPVGESWILARLYLATDDVAGALSYSEKISPDPGATISVEDGTTALTLFYETAIRGGEWRGAEKILEKLRLGFARYPLRHPTTTLFENKLALALRMHSPDLGQIAQRALADGGLWGKARMLGVIAQAMAGYRNFAKDLERRLEELNSFSPDLRWTWIRQVPFRIAKQGLLLKLGKMPSSQLPKIFQDARELEDKGRIFDSRDLHFFAVESQVALNLREEATANLTQWIRFNEEHKLFFDRDLGTILLQHLQPSSKSGRDSFWQPEAVAAADNLLAQWPWNVRIGASAFLKVSPIEIKLDSEDRLKQGSARLRYANILLEYFEKQRGKVVSLGSITKLIWQEDYNPFVHPNRIYQIIIDCRYLLRKMGFEKDSIRSNYGNGYIFEPIVLGLLSDTTRLLDDIKQILQSSKFVTVASVSEKLQISRTHSRRLLKQLVQIGFAKQFLEKGVRRYFAMADRKRKVS